MFIENDLNNYIPFENDFQKKHTAIIPKNDIANKILRTKEQRLMDPVMLQAIRDSNGNLL